MKDAAERTEASHKEMAAIHDKLVEEKNILAEQLAAETELCQEAEEGRNRLNQRKCEMEDALADMELRLADEDEKNIKMAEDKKKFQQGIQDLEER